MIQKEGPDVGDSTYTARVHVFSNIKYLIKLEVLRSDLGSSDEKVSDIIFDETRLGECNPPGSDYACDFFDCTSSLTSNEIVSEKGFVDVELKYVGHSHDCDCDTATWECSQENTITGRTPMVAAARITLTPKG